MKLKKYLVLFIALFISFTSFNKVEAKTLKQTEFNKSLMILVNPNIKPTVPGAITQETDTSGGSIGSNNADGPSSGTSSSAWCEQFNQVWYVFGIIIQIIYVVTPLLLIVTGSITTIQAMMQKDESSIKKAQNLLVKKIIVAVIVFLMVSITKMVIGLVADEGWTTCANCAFNPSQENCGIEKVPTG